MISIKMPLVTVVIPSFNRYDLIQDTIKSVHAQTMSDWELLIVDDGSTDNTQEIVRRYAEEDSRIRLLERTYQPKGPSSCRNIGIAEARAPYCIFLDSDDLLAPACLAERTSSALADPDVALHVFQMQFFYSHPGDTDKLFMYADAKDALGSSLLQGSPWGITCPLWRTDVLRVLNGFDEMLRSSEDWDLHIRAFVNGYSYKIHPIVDCFCRQGLVSLTSEIKNIAHLTQKIHLYIRLDRLFDEHNLLPKYKARLAGKCLVLCGELNELGNYHEADEAWARFSNEGVLTTKQTKIGGRYLYLRRTVFKNQSGFLTKVLRKAFSSLTTVDFAWGY